MQHYCIVRLQLVAGLIYSVLLPATRSSAAVLHLVDEERNRRPDH